MKALCWFDKHDVRVEEVRDPEIRSPRDAINLRRVAFGMVTSVHAKRNGRLSEVNPFNLSVKLFAESSEQLMKSLLYRRVPTPRRPSGRRRLRLVIILELVLPVSSAVVLRVINQILRHRNPALAERYVLKLNPKLLAV